MYRDGVSVDTIVNTAWKQLSDILYKRNSATNNYSGVAVDISTIPDYIYDVKTICKTDGVEKKHIEILSKLALPENDSVEYMYHSEIISGSGEYKDRLKKLNERLVQGYGI
jgi:hypothetical protein